MGQHTIRGSGETFEEVQLLKVGEVDRMYGKIVSASPHIILVLRHDGTVQFANQEFAGSISDSVEAAFSQFCEASQLPSIVAMLRQTESSEAPECVEVSTLCDGLRKRYSIRIQRFAVPDSAPLLFAFVDDVTEQKEELQTHKQALAELAESQRKLDQMRRLKDLGGLAGGIAHDFNNLLTTIISFSRFVLDDLPEGDPRRDDLTEVLRAADSAARLTGQLLSFARQKPVQLTVMDVNESVRSLHKMLRRTVGSNIELLILLSDDPLFILFDLAQFDQIVLNLVVNARDAMPNGGTLTIETATRVSSPTGQKQISLTIKDTGCGIPSSDIDRVFEPLFSSKGARGTGLGLATCYGLVTQANGSITLKSEVDVGTEVIVLLPVAEHEPRMQRNTVEAHTSIGSFGLLRVLVVEDQEAIRRLIVRTLRAEGIEVVEARSAQEALVIAEGSKRIDILVTDVILPGLSGIELTAKIRQKSNLLPVLFMSGYMGDGDSQEIARISSAAFLAKPFSSKQFLIRFQKLWKQTRGQQRILSD